MTKEIIGIYKITNKINGKIYIGQSVNIINRKKTHYRKYHKGCPHLYNAMDKYGFDNFEFEVIEECDIEDLDRLEQKYIKELNTFSPNGYNLDTGDLLINN
jgi:group I intron endonuclease